MRTKKILHQNITDEDFQEAFSKYAFANAKEKKIVAQMELAIVSVREKYKPELENIQKNKDEDFEILKTWALENQNTFGTKKSKDFSHGTLGFRTGTPKLKTLKGFTWASVLNLVREFLPQYIRSSEEVAKDRLLSDRSQIQTELLQKIGIEVVQDESFFVEPKQEIKVI